MAEILPKPQPSSLALWERADAGSKQRFLSVSGQMKEKSFKIATVRVTIGPGQSQFIPIVLASF